MGVRFREFYIGNHGNQRGVTYASNLINSIVLEGGRGAGGLGSAQDWWCVNNLAWDRQRSEM